MPSLCSAGVLTQGFVRAHCKLSYMGSPLSVGVCVCPSVDGGQITALGGVVSFIYSVLDSELVLGMFTRGL